MHVYRVYTLCHASSFFCEQGHRTSSLSQTGLLSKQIVFLGQLFIASVFLHKRCLFCRHLFFIFTKRLHFHKACPRRSRLLCSYTLVAKETNSEHKQPYLRRSSCQCCQKSCLGKPTWTWWGRRPKRARWRHRPDRPRRSRGRCRRRCRRPKRGQWCRHPKHGPYRPCHGQCSRKVLGIPNDGAKNMTTTKEKTAQNHKIHQWNPSMKNLPGLKNLGVFPGWKSPKVRKTRTPRRRRKSHSRCLEP